jgi:hypothetical protein
MMPTPSKKAILNQLHSLRHTGFAQKLAQAAGKHKFSEPYFFAIASRETNCVNELGDPRNGEFHGVGIVQIDIQHPIARKARDSGSWKTNPDPLIDFGAQILQDNIQKSKQDFPNLNEQQQLKIAASGYNCGMVNAISGARHGDSDLHTTGRDYGRDVMTREAIFAELIAEGN